MEKEFVTYEIALKLKEIGFNEKCLAEFTVLKDKQVLFLNGFMFTNEKVAPNVPAPLWQQAIDWLRTKHNLFIKIGIDDAVTLNEKIYDNVILQTNWGTDKEVRLLGRMGGFKTYEEAREAAILKALKYIQ